MKKCFFLMLLCLLVCLWGCQSPADGGPRVAASTRPVALFTELLLDGSGIGVDPVITEAVSCLHDHTLTVEQMKTLERADAVILSGAGLEDFMSDALRGRENVIDASAGLSLLQDAHGHADPHIWLEPASAAAMARNIAESLSALYPEQEARIEENLTALEGRLQALNTELQALSALETPGLVTFHNGFAYFARAAGLPLLASMEEEHGSEVSARDLTDIIALVKELGIRAIFIESHGADGAAQVVAQETGVEIFTLDMAMGDRDYFSAMEHNIQTVKEAFS